MNVCQQLEVADELKRKMGSLQYGIKQHKEAIEKATVSQVRLHDHGYAICWTTMKEQQEILDMYLAMIRKRIAIIEVELQELELEAQGLFR